MEEFCIGILKTKQKQNEPFDKTKNDAKVSAWNKTASGKQGSAFGKQGFACGETNSNLITI